MPRTLHQVAVPSRPRAPGRCGRVALTWWPYSWVRAGRTWPAGWLGTNIVAPPREPQR